VNELIPTDYQCLTEAILTIRHQSESRHPKSPIGRKNYLFMGSDNGGKIAAVPTASCQRQGESGRAVYVRPGPTAPVVGLLAARGYEFASRYLVGGPPEISPVLVAVPKRPLSCDTKKLNFDDYSGT